MQKRNEHFSVSCGPALTIATTARVGVAAEARGVTVTAEAEGTAGDPGASPSFRLLQGTVGTWCGR